ncbi:MAG: heme-binding domain-containing protein [Flavobacteriaceae bacterium]|nr:heme-binding domain-containing protein [Flavobacteriaceae bacterium]
MKILKKIGWFLLVALLIAQFFSPEKNNGDLTSITAFVQETNPPDNVHEILKTTCFDCHSNFTRYPWYNNITPVNYWMADHVRHGKGEVNFSEWSTYSLKKKEHKMEEVYEEVEEKHMPLESYTWIHSDAKLTDEQIKAVVDWAKSVQSDFKSQLNN